jgi:prophage antirepressor-like protein
MNSTDLSVFTYQTQPVRTVSIDGEPWFVLKDVCEAISLANPSDTASRIDDDEKGIAQIDTLGGRQKMTVINEPGLYNVILRSDKPEAKSFKRWVTHEVLPVLRKTGSYTLAPMSPAEMFLAQAKAMVELEHQNRAITQRLDSQQQTLEKAVSVFALPTVEVEHWRDEMNTHISGLCERFGLSQQVFRGETYAELEETANVILSSRVKRKKERMRKGGAKYREREAVTKLHVISEDDKLRSIYESIIRKRESQLIVARAPKKEPYRPARTSAERWAD